jgi:hypothetical protein
VVIDRIELSADRLERRFNLGIDACVRLIFGECFEVAKWSEDGPAVALDDKAVGVVIGKLKDGVSASRALYVSDDGALTHGPLRVLGQTSEGFSVVAGDPQEY